MTCLNIRVKLEQKYAVKATWRHRVNKALYKPWKWCWKLFSALVPNWNSEEQCLVLSKKWVVFIALPGKGGHSGLLPLKTMSPNAGEFYEEFYIKGSRVGLLTGLGCIQSLWTLDLISDGKSLMFNSWVSLGPLIFSSPPLISNCLILPFGAQGKSKRLESWLQEMWDKKVSMPRSPSGSFSVSGRSSSLNNFL